MVTLLNETIQLIHINPNVEVNTALVKRAMVMAKSTKNYAKFYTDKYYIIVNFNKDNTMNISYNIRNLDFYREFMRLQNTVKSKTDISAYAIFITRWLNKIRKGIVY